MIDFSIYNSVYSYSSDGDLNKFNECADEIKKSFGVATAEEKNAVSHRFRALQQLLKKWKEDGAGTR